MNYLIKIFFVIFFLAQPVWALVKDWSSSLPQKSQFVASPELRGRVDFWKRIYSEVSVNAGLLHDPHHPEKVYKHISWAHIQNNKSLSAVAKKRKIEKYIQFERLRVARKYKIKNLKSIRLQTGLKERMQKALFLSGRYLPMMEEIFRQENLPIELTRLVFVESSFNVNAQSKVGASGLWQIMPFVARPEGYITKYYDKRNHPYYATLLAADILKQNYRSLKKWPLAISAYNHGLGGVKKMVRVSQSNRLPDMIASPDKTRTWGFASENFYSCFLAVLEVEREAKEIFGKKLLKSKPLPMNRVVTIKAVPKKKALKYFNGSITRLKKYNPHLNISAFKKSKMIPSGVPLVLPKKTKDPFFKTASR